MSRLRIAAALCACAALLAVPSTASAAVLNERIPFEFEFPSCSGETVLGSGILHVVARSDEVDGEEIFVAQHANLQNFTGVGQTSGRTYRISQTANTITHPRFSAATPLTLMTTLRVIAPGGEDDFQLFSLFHQTVNANGETTVFHNTGSLECRG